MPHESPDPQIEFAMSLILAHIQRNRGAADTFEGVTRWWLGAAGAAISPNAVRAALDRLVESGSLHARALASGKTLWYVRDASRGEDA